MDDSNGSWRTGGFLRAFDGTVKSVAGAGRVRRGQGRCGGYRTDDGEFFTLTVAFAEEERPGQQRGEHAHGAGAQGKGTQETAGAPGAVRVIHALLV